MKSTPAWRPHEIGSDYVRITANRRLIGAPEEQTGLF